MRHTVEYTWLITYLDYDSLWLEDVLNWDDTFDLVLSDYNFFSFLTSSFFLNTHVFLDSFTKMSFLDLVFFYENNTQYEPLKFYNLVLWDMLTFIPINFLQLQTLFYTDYQDFITIILYHSPELVLGLIDYVEHYWFMSVLTSQVSSVFDVFTDSTNSKFSEFVEYWMVFCFFIWGVIFFTNILAVNKWSLVQDAYFIRLTNYVYWMSREYRVQYEAALAILFMAVFYTSMMILTFDDDQEEVSEFFNTFLFYSFTSFLFYFWYKYSIHYFAFLEASVSKGRTMGYVLKQFTRDVAATVALVARFFILMIRLNIYDGVDDLYDSYYIFVGDFNDDEYFSDLFFNIFSVMFFDTDVNDDRSFFFEDELDFSRDLFAIYFIIWGKLTFFPFFILEEILRMALALFLTYLIVFEMQALNRSHVEDTYFGTKRAILNPLKEQSYI